MYTTNPAWRIARKDETPGQLEPQLEREVKTHIVDLDNNQSFCQKAVLGDRAITLEQARDPDNGMYFDCEDCYAVLSGESEDGSNKNGE
jgi:hypothetical protein